MYIYIVYIIRILLSSICIHAMSYNADVTSYVHVYVCVCVCVHVCVNPRVLGNLYLYVVGVRATRMKNVSVFFFVSFFLFSLLPTSTPNSIIGGGRAGDIAELVFAFSERETNKNQMGRKNGFRSPRRKRLRTKRVQLYSRLQPGWITITFRTFFLPCSTWSVVCVCVGGGELYE